MRLITIVGARPQFIKAAMVSRTIQERNTHTGYSIEEKLLHTGQHYDPNMSDIFFNTMRIPQPSWQLQCGNRTHGEMTGQLLIEIERILMDERPDAVLVYGDTNSTLAGALAASKLRIPVVHVEAGLRSFNKRMPEETNRILTDHMASLLFCPTYTAISHLKREGITEGVYHVGDVMYDAALVFGELADASSRIIQRLGLTDRPFRLCTIHRAENTDNRDRMFQIIEAIQAISSPACPTVLPLHPRTQGYLERYGWLSSLQKEDGILLIPPVGYLDMIMLEKQASTILTDSGGMQKEAYFHHTPCITLREETEWVETVEAGWNQIAGYKKERILQCLTHPQERHEIEEYGRGNASEIIIDRLWDIF